MEGTRAFHTIVVIRLVTLSFGGKKIGAAISPYFSYVVTKLHLAIM